MTTIDDFQTNLNRRPLVELISSSLQADIPFDGVFLNSNDENETHPSSIVHSTGRILTVFIRDRTLSVDNQEIHFKFTDVNRTEFQTVITWESAQVLSDIEGVSLTELKNGNVGVIWLEYSGGKYFLKYRIVDEVGILVTQGEVDNWTADQGNASGPAVLHLG